MDGFQGREKDVIIFSCVRAPGLSSLESHPLEISSIGFLKEPERLNVAITRAKYALWIVGHAHTLRRGDQEWRILVNYCEANK